MTPLMQENFWWKGGQRVPEAGLSDHAVARILQARVQAAGVDPARYGGHSLRAGFVTAAARAGADVWKIQQVGRHRSMQVLSGYVRDARLFDDQLRTSSSSPARSRQNRSGGSPRRVRTGSASPDYGDRCLTVREARSRC